MKVTAGPDTKLENSMFMKFMDVSGVTAEEGLDPVPVAAAFSVALLEVEFLVPFPLPLF